MICMCVCNMFQVPASGMLILTDEEKRTLIAEGYSVPTRWPLTKQDEKNLKKVQRKIKNKVVKHTMCYIHYTVVAMMHLYCTIHSSDTVKLLFLRHLCCSLDLHFPCIWRAWCGADVSTRKQTQEERLCRHPWKTVCKIIKSFNNIQSKVFKWCLQVLILVTNCVLWHVRQMRQSFGLIRYGCI